MRCGFPPFAPTTKMSYSPAAFESKAILPPSGDQRGVVTSGPPKEVNCTAFEPSLSQTQISGCPERVEMKAIFLPSGENCGAWSSLVEEMRGVSVSPGRFFRVPTLGLPDAAMRQMLRCRKNRAQARRLPWRETAGLMMFPPRDPSGRGSAGRPADEGTATLHRPDTGFAKMISCPSA